jgi:hypothetical protein
MLTTSQGAFIYYKIDSQPVSHKYQNCSKLHPISRGKQAINTRNTAIYALLLPHNCIKNPLQPAPDSLILLQFGCNFACDIKNT